MTLPTQLSILRILLTFVIMGLVLVPNLSVKVAALFVFVIAAFTDWLDGYLARRHQQETPLGALLDPIADKVLVLGLFIVFVQLHVVPAWMVIVILLREFLITGVRLVAARRQVVLAAAKEGKHKTVSQMVTIGAILLVLVAREASPTWLTADVDQGLGMLIVVCMAVTVALTIFSGAGFFWRHRHVLWESVSR